MKKLSFLALGLCLALASENQIKDKYPKKELKITEEQRKLLEESQKQMQPAPNVPKSIKGSIEVEEVRRAQTKGNGAGREEGVGDVAEGGGQDEQDRGHQEQNGKDQSGQKGQRQNGGDRGDQNVRGQKGSGKGLEQGRESEIGEKSNGESTKKKSQRGDPRSQNDESGAGITDGPSDDLAEKIWKGDKSKNGVKASKDVGMKSQGGDLKSHNGVKADTNRDAKKQEIDDPYAGLKKEKRGAKERGPQISFDKKWIYGTAVITTTFLDGSIKRSYGILLRDGLFVTSANMVYNQNIYARSSYAMMQDDSSLPFICVAKLSIKALDLQRGLTILETLSFTDIYCNPREKTYYQDRIYSSYWIDIFSHREETPAVIYSPYITELNSFATAQHILQGSLEELAKKESWDFEGYKYAYGKGFYTANGRLLGIIGASHDDEPKLIKTKEIAGFLCELRDRKILKNAYLQSLCPAREGKIGLKN